MKVCSIKNQVIDEFGKFLDTKQIAEWKTRGPDGAKIIERNNLN